MGKGVILKGKNKESIYPMSSSDLIFDPSTKKSVMSDLKGKVEEAPKNGKQYARINGAWSEVAAGAISETALITLTPNDEELKGVSVKVTTNEGYTILDTTWQGTVLTVEIREGLQYTVAVGSMDGYITPTSVTYTAIRGTTRSINMEYTTSMLKVNILSNQPDDSTIASVKATVTYGSTSVQVVNGGKVNIPLNANVTISFPLVDGYKAPEPISFKYTGGLVEHNGIYRTQILTVNVTGSGATPSGYTITINDKSNNVVLFTQTSSSATYKIPWGISYSISASPLNGYNSVSSQEGIADSISRTHTLTYVYITDPGITNPSNGVWIYAKNKKYYTIENWDNSPSGADSIALITDNRSLRIALKDTSSIIQWGGYQKLTSGITTTLEQTEAKNDYDGYEQTTTIINDLDGYDDGHIVGSGAALKCKNFRFPGGSYGYLGAYGEWNLVFQNFTAVNNALEKCGGTKLITTISYWTSTQGSADWAWMIGMISEPVNKMSTARARAFTKIN